MAKTPSKSKDTKQTQDAVELLMEDHRKVEKLVAEFSSLKEGSEEEKEDLVEQVCTELRVHAQLEEEIFYPAVEEALEQNDLVNEARVEHSVVKQLIADLEDMDPDDELYDATFKVLGEYVKHHVQEEEKEMMPQAKRAKVDMQALGSEIALRKQELMEEEGLDVEEEEVDVEVDEEEEPREEVQEPANKRRRK